MPSPKYKDQAKKVKKVKTVSPLTEAQALPAIPVKPKRPPVLGAGCLPDHVITAGIDPDDSEALLAAYHVPRGVTALNVESGNQLDRLTGVPGTLLPVSLYLSLVQLDELWEDWRMDERLEMIEKGATTAQKCAVFGFTIACRKPRSTDEKFIQMAKDMGLYDKFWVTAMPDIEQRLERWWLAGDTLTHYQNISRSYYG